MDCKVGIWGVPEVVGKTYEPIVLWEWEALTETMLTRHAAVAFPDYKLINGRRQQVMKPLGDRDGFRVCRAFSAGAYHPIREGRGPLAGKYWARFSPFSGKFAKDNNLILVERPTEEGKVVIFEYGLRKLHKVLVATAQCQVRTFSDPMDQNYLPLSHGLRRLIAEAWPGTAMSGEPISENVPVPDEVFHSHLPVTVIWHSLRLGLIKARTDGGSYVFFRDCMFFRRGTDLHLITEGRRLLYHPPPSPKPESEPWKPEHIGSIPYIKAGSIGKLKNRKPTGASPVA